MEKPLPYCTPDMRRMLRNLKEAKPIDTGIRAKRQGLMLIRSALRSRGWIDNTGAITHAGLQIVAD